MTLVKLSPEEVQRRWADIRHLYDEGGWPQNQVPSWVYDVLRDHHGGRKLNDVGIGGVIWASLFDMVGSLLAKKDEIKSSIETE